MTRESPELLSVCRRWFDAVQQKRGKEVQNILIDKDHMLFIGTGEDELWSGTAVRAGIADFFGSIPTIIKQEETFGAAYEYGRVGWACFTHNVVLAHNPDKVFPVRNTLIFTLEDGFWRMVHRHGSVPLPNEEFVGSKQTAIADLVAAAAEGFAIDQTDGFASIMFTDIVNSSGLASVMGDCLWTSVVSEHFKQLQAIVEKASGQFVKSLGDGTLSSFPKPEYALDAARNIHESIKRSGGPAISVRVGIHAGSVVRIEDDFFGTVVNKAARITAIAAPNETWVSDVMPKQVSGKAHYHFVEAGLFELDGFEGEHLLWSLK
ncbi:nuclear transport factor 2 family protein [Lutimaribacter marinistellae]|uniref:Nuclear transport factor 2 family protein n=1 Tax=Lutimaribacter marinistellae TaxID=1820329 RepID=A0ABV7TPG0_9RHOB